MGRYPRSPARIRILVFAQRPLPAFTIYRASDLTATTGHGRVQATSDESLTGLQDMWLQEDKGS